MLRIIIASWALLLCAAPVWAESALSVAYPLTDHAVLLRDSMIPIRGRAPSGATVTVSFAGQSVQAKADGNGAWQLQLQPLTTNATGRELVVAAGADRLVLKNILVGEVWFCGGQSNMAIAGKRDGGLMTTTQPSMVRLIGFGENHAAPKTWANGHTHAGDAKGKPLVASTHAWQFALALHEELNMPVGVMVAAKGASQVSIGKWSARFKDYPIRGVLFDQGESGGGPLTADGRLDWPAGMREVISFWRTQWHNPKLPVLLCQKPAGGGCAADWDERVLRETRKEERQLSPLPARVPRYLNSRSGSHWFGNSEYFREYFTREMWQDEQVFIVQTVDLESGLHPKFKTGVGRRDARVAMACVYGVKDLAWHGPRYASHAISGDTVTVQFEMVGDGLKSAYSKQVQGFALAGVDKVFHWAEASITGPATVQLRSPQVPKPLAVRYGWALDRSWANVFSSAGLPMASFRTDDWTPWGILEAKGREEKRWETKVKLNQRMSRDKDHHRGFTLQKAGESFTVRWQTGGGTGVRLHPLPDPVAEQGEHTFTVQENTTIALQVDGPGGPQYRTLNLQVPRTIAAGDASAASKGFTLSWYAYDSTAPLSTAGKALGTAQVKGMSQDLGHRRAVVKQPATLVFEGVIDITEAGYTSFTASKSGAGGDPVLATLHVGGVRVIDRSMGQGGATLAKGLHRVRLVCCLPHAQAGISVKMAQGKGKKRR